MIEAELTTGVIDPTTSLTTGVIDPTPSAQLTQVVV